MGEEIRTDGNRNLRGFLKIYNRESYEQSNNGNKTEESSWANVKSTVVSTRNFQKRKNNVQRHLVSAIFFLIILLILENILMMTSEIILPSKPKL